MAFSTPLFYVLCAGSLLLPASRAAAQKPTTSLTLYSTIPIASPTAASLGKFTDIPVSYHTGIPEVSVPLYTVKEGPLTLPIGVSYHAGGIKVQDPAGWVGMGWALNAGGVITRSVMGAPDESGTTNARYGHFSDYGFNSYWTTDGTRGNSSSQAAPNDKAFVTNSFDGEPDLFFFNFNGYSGKFYFSDDRTPVVVDGQDLKIEYYYPRPTGASTLASNNIQGFIITVPSGDRYYFGNTGGFAPTATLPVEQTYPFSGANSSVDNSVYSSYYLHKIVAADNVHTITLTYKPERYSYYTLSTYPISIQQPVASNANPTPARNIEFSLVKNNIDGVRLATVLFATGKAAFTPAATLRTDLGGYLKGGLNDQPNEEARALGSIAITNSDSSFCKRFAFSYGYFQGDKTALSSYLATPSGDSIRTDRTRLRLDQIVEQVCDGSVAANPWKFTYNGTFLPRRLSFAQDHWGFYNGATNNNSLNTLIPTYTVNTFTAVAGANREPARPYMAVGMLTKLTYPTGGSATFDFEPNKVYVKYNKISYENIFEQGVGSFTPHQAVQVVFSGKPCRCKLSYSNNTCSVFSPTSRSATLSDQNKISLTVSRLLSQTYEEETFQSAPGKRTVFLTLSSQCDNDIARGTIEEISTQTVAADTLAGGLRIKTITVRERAGVPGMVTSYFYKEATGQSSGILYNRPRYVQIVRNSILAKYGYSTSTGISHPEGHGCLGPETNNNNQIYLTSPCSILPLSTTQGSHIGYGLVTVVKPTNGRTEYHYAAASQSGRIYEDVCVRNVAPGFCDPAIPSLPAVPLAYEYDRGQLKYQSDYDDQKQLVRTVAYEHTYDSTRLVTPAYLVRNVADALLGAFYVRRGYWQTRLLTTEKLYSPAAPAYETTQTQYFKSPFHHQLTRTVQTGSSGDTVETRTRYAFDVRTPAPDALATGQPAYEAACAECGTKFRQQLSMCADAECRRNAYLDSLLCHSAARQQYVRYRRQTFTDSVNTFQAQHDAAKQAADAPLRALLQLQDDGRNEEVESTRWKNRQLLSATYTGFGPGLSQPTVLYPSRQFGLFLAAPTATFQPVAVSGNQLLLDARYAPIPEVVLTFDKGALVEQRLRKGTSTAYLWGYSTTLPLAKAVGVSYATLQAAYQAAGNDLTALRKAPALAHAHLITYSHQLLVGLRSETDITGRAFTYEYDGLGRLVRTRDEQSRILGQQQYHYAGQ